MEHKNTERIRWKIWYVALLIWLIVMIICSFLFTLKWNVAL